MPSVEITHEKTKRKRLLAGDVSRANRRGSVCESHPGGLWTQITARRDFGSPVSQVRTSLTGDIGATEGVARMSGEQITVTVALTR